MAPIDRWDAPTTRAERLALGWVQIVGPVLLCAGLAALVVRLVAELAGWLP